MLFGGDSRRTPRSIQSCTCRSKLVLQFASFSVVAIGEVINCAAWSKRNFDNNGYSILFSPSSVGRSFGCRDEARPPGRSRPVSYYTIFGSIESRERTVKAVSSAQKSMMLLNGRKFRKEKRVHLNLQPLRRMNAANALHRINPQLLLQWWRPSVSCCFCYFFCRWGFLSNHRSWVWLSKLSSLTPLFSSDNLPFWNPASWWQRKKEQDWDDSSSFQELSIKHFAALSFC